MENKKVISLYKSGKVYSELEIQALKKQTSSKFIEQEYASTTGIKGNETMQELLENYGVPCLGGEQVFAEIEKYGYTFNGICSGFKWKDTISEISNEEAWKIIALSSIYWKNRYENSYDKYENENKQLKYRIAELEKENAKLLDSVETVQNNRCMLKCELTEKQLKQFAELLKEIVHKRDYVERYAEIGLCEEIDEALKEELKNG